MQEIPGSVLAVLVVYGRQLDDVAGWPVLRNWLARGCSGSLQLRHVLVYDNSSVSNLQPALAQVPDTTYVHDAANGGTTAAYRHAADLAVRLGYEWLLLLDHDTVLPATFLETASQALEKTTPTAPSALVPRVAHGRRLISPACLTRFGSVRPLAAEQELDPSLRITAIGSGTLLNARCLQAMMPFPSGLWLDYVDHWIFNELHQRRACVGIFEATLAHDLSIESPKLLSPARLVSILEGEALLHRQLGAVARCVYPLRLMARTLRYLKLNPVLASRTIRWAFNRLLGSH